VVLSWRDKTRQPTKQQVYMCVRVSRRCVRVCVSAAQDEHEHERCTLVERASRYQSITLYQRSEISTQNYASEDEVQICSTADVDVEELVEQSGHSMAWRKACRLGPR
jgi:hypothetical protein